jgi:SAM-dependent methyltransferase
MDDRTLETEAIIDNEGVHCREQRECVSCGKPGVPLHINLRDRLFGAPGTWATFRCKNPECGLGWLNPQPLAAEVIKFYRDYYTHAATDEPGEVAHVQARPYRRFRRWFRQLKRRLLAGLLPWWRLRFDTNLSYVGNAHPGRLLEVGCGTGQFLREAQAAGWDAVGIDFDPEAVKIARRAGANARASDLFAENFPDKSFDAIFMDNVIEHLPDPPAVFEECYRLLRPRGRLILLTPNLDGYLHELYRADWRGLEVPRHLYLFGAAAMRSLAHRARFRHVEVFSQPVLRFNVALMINQSKLIAERSGRKVPDADPTTILQRAARLGWLRWPRGEYLVLAAER